MTAFRGPSCSTSTGSQPSFCPSHQGLSWAPGHPVGDRCPHPRPRGSGALLFLLVSSTCHTQTLQASPAPSRAEPGPLGCGCSGRSTVEPRGLSSWGDPGERRSSRGEGTRVAVLEADESFSSCLLQVTSAGPCTRLLTSVIPPNSLAVLGVEDRAENGERCSSHGPKERSRAQTVTEPSSTSIPG